MCAMLPNNKEPDTRELRASELRYRRLFEAALDGILILDAGTGMVVDVNPFLVKLLGYSREVFLGKKIWELGIFKDLIANEEDFRRLQARDYIRFKDLPLETSDGRRIMVEFVFNAYLVDDHRVIQCHIRDVTARKRTEAELNTQQQRLRTLIDNLPDSIYIKDTASRFVVVNVAVARRVGLADPKLLIGRTDADFHPPDLARQYRADEELVMQTGRAILAKEEQVRTAAGELHWSSITKVPLKDATGAVTGLVGISRDITALKQANLNLAREQMLLNQLITTIPDHIYFKDRASRFIRINAAQAASFGLRDPREAVGKSDADFFSAEHARQAYADEQQLMATGQPLVGVEEKETWPDGRVTWVSTTKVPLRDPAGAVIGLVGISRDITAHKQAEAAVQLLSAIVESSDDAIISQGMDGNVTSWNRGAERLFGYSAAEMVGRSIALLFPPAREDEEPRNMERIRRGEPVENFETERLRKDGQTIPVSLTISPVKDSRGQLVGASKIIRDISGRKRA
jgi:PAS domain S-box-containing protein